MNFNNKTSLEILDEINNLQGVLKNSSFEDIVTLELNNANDEKLKTIALKLRPWRKGPFKINELFIDSEWRSFIKFNSLLPYFNPENKRIADIGCNNGYYMFRLNSLGAKEVIGFDPSILFWLQFKFINHFLKTKICYETLGVQDLTKYAKEQGFFDLIFCLGVLYHRSDPIATLKQLKSGLKSGGELILDTLIIERNDELVLSPTKSYAKMSNVFFIPSLMALEGWSKRAKFSTFELLFITQTDLNEQRKTPWIYGQSLDDFICQNHYTKEGYEPLKRAYIKLK